MLGDVVKKAGENAGSAIGAGTEQVAHSYLDFMFSPWGVVAVVVVFWLLTKIR